MQDDFKKSILRDPIWMLGDVVQDADGEYKLEWNCPKRGKFLKTEEALAMHLRSSEDMLIHRHKSVEPEWTLEVWAKWRDIALNAERGLQKLQRYKNENNITLSTPFRPRMPEC